MSLPHFCSTIPRRKKMRAHANRDPNMQEVGFYEAAQNFVYLT